MDGKRLIEKIKLRNILSFGDKGEEITLEPLNIIIGQNASGKSNLIEVLKILMEVGSGTLATYMNNHDITEYLWKGKALFPKAEIEVYFTFEEFREDQIFYRLVFGKVGQRFEVIEEEISPLKKEFEEDFYYKNLNKERLLVFYDEKLNLAKDDKPKVRKLEYKFDEIKDSILGSIQKEMTGYPVIRKIERSFGDIEIYEDWHFHPYRPPKQSINFNNKIHFLKKDGENLALVIDEFRHKPEIYEKVVKYLKTVYRQIDKLKVERQAGKIQLFIEEKGTEERIPSSRFSNGTLRYLCLLAILCHPEPPPLICIEEPETGLHPDILPTIAELMKEASQRTQLIVTTHSDILVSAFSDMPEAVLVCEKDEDGTHFKRLNEEELKIWMEDYKDLGEIWLRGGLGGTRW